MSLRSHSLASSLSVLIIEGFPSITVNGLSYDVDGSACGFDLLTVGDRLAFSSMSDLVEVLPSSLFAPIKAALDEEALLVSQSDTKTISELRAWLDRRRG
jgi:hypothetical protein